MKLINAYGLTREQSTSSDEYFPMNISDFKNVEMNYFVAEENTLLPAAKPTFK